MSRTESTPAGRAAIGILLAAVATGIAGSPRMSLAEEIDVPAVRQVLASRCFGCHGERKRSGRLRLDSRAAALAGGRSGAAIVPGKSAESLVVARVLDGAAEPMPPPGKGERLTAAEIELLRAWIDAGADAAALDASEGSAGGVVPSVALRVLPSGYAPTWAVALSRDGALVAVARGARVEILTADEGELTRERRLRHILDGHRDVVQSLAFGGSRSELLATGGFRVVQLWSVETGELVATLEDHVDRVLALSFDDSGERLLAAGGVPSDRGELVCWRVGSRERLWEWGETTDSLLSVSWSRDGERILCGGADRDAHLLDATEAGTLVRRLEGSSHHVLGVDFSPTRSEAVTVGVDETLRFFDVETGFAREETGRHGQRALWVAWIPPAEVSPGPNAEEEDAAEAAARAPGRVLTISEDGTIRDWNPTEVKERRRFGGGLSDVQAAAVSRDGRRVAAATESGALDVHDVESGRRVLRLEIPPRAP